MPKPSIIFMGTPHFACPSLSLIAQNFTVKAVITAPDKPAGRGQKLSASPIKELALSLNLPVLQPKNLKHPDFIQELKSFHADLFIVLAFRMLPEVVWDMPKLGTINLHASLLPNYRGAAPINWALINGESKSGLTTFFIEKEIDTGKVLLQKELEIGANESLGSLHDRMMEAGASLLVETINGIGDDSLEATSQDLMIKDLAEIKEAPKLFKENTKIDWNKTAREIHNLIRGLDPFPSAWSDLKIGEEMQAVKLFDSKLSDQQLDRALGECVFQKPNLLIQTGDGTVEIGMIKAPGKRKMPVSDWFNGLDRSKTLQFC